MTPVTSKHRQCRLPYYTRETAIAFSRIVNATVIMGSATPDVVTYHRARSDTYRPQLPRRVMGHRTRLTEQAERIGRNLTYQALEGDPDDAVTIPLPPVELVDLRQELRAGNRSIFSRRLQTAIDETLARREQAILFLNRRGTASFVICRDCGHVALSTLRHAVDVPSAEFGTHLPLLRTPRAATQ